MRSRSPGVPCPVYFLHPFPLLVFGLDEVGMIHLIDFLDDFGLILGCEVSVRLILFIWIDDNSNGKIFTQKLLHHWFQSKVELL